MAWSSTSIQTCFCSVIVEDFYYLEGREVVRLFYFRRQYEPMLKICSYFSGTLDYFSPILKIGHILTRSFSQFWCERSLSVTIILVKSIDDKTLLDGTFVRLIRYRRHSHVLSLVRRYRGTCSFWRTIQRSRTIIFAHPIRILRGGCWMA